MILCLPFISLTVVEFFFHICWLFDFFYTVLFISFAYYFIDFELISKSSLYVNAL